MRLSSCFEGHYDQLDRDAPVRLPGTRAPGRVSPKGRIRRGLRTRGCRPGRAGAGRGRGTGCPWRRTARPMRLSRSIRDAGGNDAARRVPDDFAPRASESRDTHGPPSRGIPPAKTKGIARGQSLLFQWSGREDSNFRPPAPHAGALPGCATPRPNLRLYRRPRVKTSEAGCGFPRVPAGRRPARACSPARRRPRWRCSSSRAPRRAVRPLRFRAGGGRR